MFGEYEVKFEIGVVVEAENEEEAKEQATEILRDDILEGNVIIDCPASVKLLRSLGDEEGG